MQTILNISSFSSVARTSHLLRCALPVVALFLWCASPSPAADNWQTYKGVTVWTQYPNKARTFTWSGNTDADGKAQGPGTYVVYLNAKKVVTYTGTMEAGRMSGQVMAIYHQVNKTYEGEIRDNSENGFGTMRDADGTVRTGRWVDGELVEPGPAATTPTAATAPAAVATTAPSAAANRAPAAPAAVLVDLPSGLAAPRADASVAEKFVYQLAVITRHYCLDMAYRPKVTDDELDDAHWTVERSAAVAALLHSSLAAQVPAPLRDFCVESQRLDATFQAIAKFAFDSAESGRSQAWQMLQDRLFGNSSRDEQPADPDVRLFGDILKFNGNTADWLRAREQMLRNFAQYKRDRAFHTRWASLLTDLATGDPGLAPYAARPEATDPTLHYMRNRLASDVFPGMAIAPSRTGLGSGFTATPITVDLGDIRRGPVRVRLPKRGFAFYNLSMTGTSYGMVFAGQCTRGHLGFYNDSLESAWIARGITDGKKNGRLTFPGEDSGRGVHIQIKFCHVPVASRNSDEEVDGSLLIYLSQQYGSDAAALGAARTIYLRPAGQFSDNSQ